MSARRPVSIALKELIAEVFSPSCRDGCCRMARQEAREFPRVPLFEELLGAQKPTGSCLASLYHGRRLRRLWPAVADSKKTPPDIVKVYRDTMGAHRKDKEFAAELAKVAGDDAEVLSMQRANRSCAGCSFSPGAKEFAQNMMKKYLNSGDAPFGSYSNSSSDTTSECFR